MNKRRIQERLITIHREWVESITDLKVRELAEKNSILTGGAIVSLLQNKEPKDYDFYFVDKETTIAVAEYYADIVSGLSGHCIKVIDGHRYLQDLEEYPNFDDIDKEKYWWFSENTYNMTKDRVRIFIQSSGVLRYPEHDKKNKEKQFRPVFVSSNAVTLSDKIQLINRFYGEPEEIHETFDYQHTFSYWRSDTKELCLNPEALECILDKRLVYKGSRYPLCSIIRMRKFMSRGWTINAGQILKMMYQLSELDLSDVEVLEDQLIGVDTAYFNSIIYRIKKETTLNKDFKIDETIIAKLVEEIFG